ncbi:hypothetical protein K491DRAFT_157960 [Lophiostoma macrostomum CBS 122681]|uniref:Uncharacterized protein n=1 Tax=Lophiostoma macrostomum CBS 122681 TaxID=1314788 RepID=A0A6A6STM9_9PLEO|nr:hypothetical protein K491DRAFT_157960 [Lophiostoma macrostomum CBS 122681]
MTRWGSPGGKRGGLPSRRSTQEQWWADVAIQSDEQAQAGPSPSRANRLSTPRSVCSVWAQRAASLSNIAEELFQYECVSLVAVKKLRCVYCSARCAGRGFALIAPVQTGPRTLQSRARDTWATTAASEWELVGVHDVLCPAPVSADVEPCRLGRACVAVPPSASQQ